MERKIVFGKLGAVTMLINAITAKLFLGFTRNVIEIAGTAGWILCIYISALVFIGFFIISKLYSQFEGKDLLDIGEQLGGNIGRIVTGSIITAFFLFITALILREFSEDMKIISLTVSPLSFVLFFFLAGMITAAYSGLEAIVRFQTIAMPVIEILGVFLLIAVFPYVDTSNIMPVLGSGAGKIFGQGFSRISMFSEFIILFLITPYIGSYKNFKKIGYISIGLSSLFFLAGTLFVILVFPYPTSVESFLPIYQLARLIGYGRFFQRVESIFVFMWGAASLLYLSTTFYFSVYAFKKTFNLEYSKPLIFPFAIIIFVISFMPVSLNASSNITGYYFRSYSWLVTFAMPIILLLLAGMKDKASKKVKLKTCNKNDSQKK